jgi:hypothetical protein
MTPILLAMLAGRRGGDGGDRHADQRNAVLRAGARIQAGRRRALDEVGASSGESSTGTTGPEVQAPPVIVGMSLSPGPGTPGSCVLQSAGPVTVTVQVEGAVGGLDHRR